MWATTVPASPRVTGPVRGPFAACERVIHGRGPADHVMGRVLNADGCEHLLSLAQNRHEVVRGVGQGCVLQGSVGFGHVDGLATHLNHQGLRDGQEGRGRSQQLVPFNRCRSMDRPVKVMAG